MKNKEEIKERLKQLEERKEIFEETYSELKIKLPDSPSQFDNPEYKYVKGQVALLRWVLS